ncbi:MAG: agmatinase [Bacteroidota bacterium]
MRVKQFGGIPELYSNFDNAKIVILPVPFEAGTNWIKGTDKGPDALIEASASMHLYDIQSDFEAFKLGIHTGEAVKEGKSHEKMVKEVETRTMQMLKKRKFPVIIGGEHSTGIGSMKACADYYKEKDFCVLQLGAHANQRQNFNGSPYHHSCVMARASELAPVLQVGIRSMSAEERDSIKPERVFYAHNILDGTNKTWMYDFLNKLEKHVYISIDLDVFEPSVMAATANPEPGGLGWYHVLEILQAVTDKSIVVGFDVTGLCPIKYNKAPNLLAARLLYQMLNFRFAGLKK